jgi:hypothetical protein
LSTLIGLTENGEIHKANTILSLSKLPAYMWCQPQPKNMPAYNAVEKKMEFQTNRHIINESDYQPNNWPFKFTIYYF